MELSKNDLAMYEKKLLALQEELRGELAKLKEDLDFGTDSEGSSFDTETDEAEEMANSLPISRQLTERMEAVDAAITRVAAGTYGVCMKCGGDIERSVLDAAPESTLCIACKKS